MIGMFESIWMILLGFAAGVLGSMAGLGGGIIVVPVLTFLGFAPTVAASNSLFAAFSNAAASTISYSRQKRIDYNVGLKLGLFSVPGTVLGALVSADIAPEIFKLLFALVLIISGVYIFLQKNIQTKQKTTTHTTFLLVIAASFFAGVISSFFGIGGGIIFVPLMVIAMAINIRRAAPNSQFILLFASFSGLLIHSLLGHPNFLDSLYLSIGAFAGGMLGARLSLEIKEWYLRVLISIVIFIAAAKMILDSLL